MASWFLHMRNIVIRSGRSHLQVAFSHCNRIEAVKQPPIIVDRCSHVLLAKLRQYLLCGHFGFSHFAPLSNERTQKAFLHWASVEEPSRFLNFFAKSLSALHSIVRMRPTIISDLMSRLSQKRSRLKQCAYSTVFQQQIQSRLSPHPGGPD